MNSGIFDPYKPKKIKKPNFKPEDRYSDGDTDTQMSESSVRLDGQSYILEFTGIPLDEVPNKLGRLLYDVIQNENHKKMLIQNGIQLIQTPTVPNPQETTELTLNTSSGYISVYVCNEKNETEVFRRLAWAFSNLGIKSLLTKHKVRIIVR